MTRALVISGGGSKGAFAIGVLKQFQQQYPELEFDKFVGTSTGSLIVPLAALGEIDLLEQIYITQSEGTIVKKLRIGDRLNQDSIFDANPLMNLINKYFTDDKYQAIQDSGKKIYLNTTCLQTEDIVVFTNDAEAVSNDNYHVRLLQNGNHFRRAVMASACQPVFMPTIQVNRDLSGNPEKDYQYVDGGVREYAGVEMAIDAGATEIFTILLSAKTSKPENVQYTKLFELLERTMSIFITDVGKNDLVIPGQFNDALLYIDAVKKKMARAGVSADDIKKYFTIKGRENPYEEKVPLKLYNIQPDTPLGGGPGGLSFDSNDMKTMIAKGMTNTGNFLAALDPKDITWA